MRDECDHDRQMCNKLLRYFLSRYSIELILLRGVLAISDIVVMCAVRLWAVFAEVTHPKSANLDYLCLHYHFTPELILGWLVLTMTSVERSWCSLSVILCKCVLICPSSVIQSADQSTLCNGTVSRPRVFQSHQ